MEQQQNESGEPKDDKKYEDIDTEKDNNNNLVLDGNNVLSWKGFIVYESSFIVLMFLLLLWNRLDTLIASFLFTEAQIATQCLWMNIVMLMDCFSYGFEFSITSKISYFVIKDDIPSAKRVTWISN